MARRGFGRRLRATLVVGGITIGILFLIFLQFALPYWIGRAGLVVGGSIDAAAYLEMRHRRAVRRRVTMANRAARLPRVLRGTETRHQLRDETVATAALLLFLVGFFVQGAALQITNPAYPPATTNPLLFLVGEVVVTVALLLLVPYAWGSYSWTSQSEMYDTTQDQ